MLVVQILVRIIIFTTSQFKITTQQALSDAGVATLSSSIPPYHYACIYCAHSYKHLDGPMCVRTIWMTSSAQCIKLLGASRGVWEDVECKLRSISWRRVSDPRRVFLSAFGVIGISDNGYRSTIEVIMISLGTCRITGENFGCTWECC